jgi:outer membrane receptor for ferrienterochelin and colicin
MLRALLAVCLLAPVSNVAHAQGPTSAAIQGTVLGYDGSGVMGARVKLTSGANGQRWQTTTNANGRYLFEGVGIGGPYRIEVTAIGFEPASRAVLALALGERARADFTLARTAVRLPDVVTQAGRVTAVERRGAAASVITADRIASLPNMGRDFLATTTWTPAAALSPASPSAPTGGISIGGLNRAYNAFQIDGGMNQDQYSARLPGRDVLPRPISTESIEEVQVLAAPFDVRYGGFAGGLVNAVTRSGTNEMHGSLFGYVTNEALVGRSSTGSVAQPFTTRQFGATVGGPIVRDRAHYFVSVDVQRRVDPDPGPLITDTVGGAELQRIRVSYESAVRFQDILQNGYGLDPGSLGPSRGELPARDAFAKLSFQLATNDRLEISHHYAAGFRDGYIGRSAGSYQLTTAGRSDTTVSNASRAVWSLLLGDRWTNEMIVSHLHVRDECRPNANYPLLVVTLSGSGENGDLRAGMPNVCPSSFGQRGTELTDNVTLAAGAHAITLGARLDLMHFTDGLLQEGGGQWRFTNLDSLQNGVASFYQRALPGDGQPLGVDFHARQFATYVQDRWSATDRLTLSLGLRAETGSLPDPVVTNEQLRASLGFDNARLPAGTIYWSPRLSFSYDGPGSPKTQLRGGVGVFSGRPPYVWIASAYRDDGVHEMILTCQGNDVPTFDPSNQPTTCRSGGTARPRLTVFDPGVRFPRNLRASLGVDRPLAGGVNGSWDVLYNRALDALYVSDANLFEPVGYAAGEGNRPMYGTFPNAPALPARATRRDVALGQVARFANRSGDDAWSANVQLQRGLGRGDARIWYSFTRARDRMSLVNFPARALLENPPLDGTMEHRTRGVSYFEIPHRLLLQLSTVLPFSMRASLTYSGASGTPFTYVIRNDANADGIGESQIRNDIVYVPRDSADMGLLRPQQWDTLAAFIQGEPCLREQRGRILARNSCRNPWFGTWNGRLTRVVRVSAGHAIELTGDMYNIANLLHRDWGQRRVTTPGAWIPMLAMQQWDTAKQRGVYTLVLPERLQIQEFASRWQLELSARYRF